MLPVLGFYRKTLDLTTGKKSLYYKMVTIKDGFEDNNDCHCFYPFFPASIMHFFSFLVFRSPDSRVFQGQPFVDQNGVSWADSVGYWDV